MKPSLFRSIAESLAEAFPLLPRIRRSFIGLLLFCILLMVIGYADNGSVSIAVAPKQLGPYDARQVTTYADANLTLSGQLTFKHPSIWQRLLLTNNYIGVDFFSLLLLSVISIIIILITPKLQQQNLFKKDISNAIRLVGYIIMVHGIVTIYRNTVYTPSQISKLTNDEFTGFTNLPILVIAEMYFALIVIALGSIYKRGIKLQQEQDLTI